MLAMVRETKARLGEEASSTVAKPRCHKVYLLIIDTENMESISFTDISDPALYNSVQEYCYIFFLYTYDTNIVLIEPTRSCKDEEMAQTYAKLYIHNLRHLVLSQKST